MTPGCQKGIMQYADNIKITAVNDLKKIYRYNSTSVGTEISYYNLTGLQKLGIFLIYIPASEQ